MSTPPTRRNIPPDRPPPVDRPPAAPGPNPPEGDALAVWRHEMGRFDAARYNILVPQEIGAVAPMHRPVMAVVQADIRLDDRKQPVGGDIYPIPGAYGRYGLSKTFLERLSQAGGITWDWRASRRLDNGANPRRAHYRAVGRVKGLDGQWRVIVGEKELDMDVIEAELRESIPKRLERMRERPPDPATWAEATLRHELIQFQKHLLARAQSGAMNRAIRAAYGVRSSYPLEDLRKPFVVPKMVFSPDYNDPEVKRFMLAQGVGMVEELYGRPEAPNIVQVTGPALPAGEPDLIQDPDTGDLIDRRTGEVLRDTTVPDQPDGGPPQTGEAGTPPPASETSSAPAAAATAPPPSSPPAPDADVVAWDEAVEADDTAAEIRVLERLIRRKRFGGKLKKPLAQFDRYERRAFFEHLHKLAEPAAELPW